MNTLIALLVDVLGAQYSTTLQCVTEQTYDQVCPHAVT